MRAVADGRGRLDEATLRVLQNVPPGAQVRIEVIPPASGRPTTEPPATRWSTHNLLLALVLSFAVFVAALAIVGANWPWTGFSGNNTLWAWLTLLVAPIAIASLPVRLATARHPAPGWSRYLWGGALIALAVVLFGGYVLGWGWTGFRGEYFWDWIHLMLFPIVLVLLPGWFQRGVGLSRRGATLAALGFGVFVIVVVGGYRWGWSWTGFSGNTFHDWPALLIAPFLLPAACRWFQVHWTRRALPLDAGGDRP